MDTVIKSSSELEVDHGDWCQWIDLNLLFQKMTFFVFFAIMHQLNG
jgi:hypothetical protein